MSDERAISTSDELVVYVQIKYPRNIKCKHDDGRREGGGGS